MQSHSFFSYLPLWLILGAGYSAGLQHDADAQTQDTTAAPMLNLLNSTAQVTESAPVAGKWRQARRRNTLVDSCTTVSGGTGTCLTRLRCMRQGGIVNGYCGTYGVCCETNMQCGTSTRQKRTIITNPTPLPTTCLYTIEAFNANVQQLRIDMELFVLKEPTPPNAANGNMLECEDSFEAGGFKLCGVNSRQHLYLPLSVADGMDSITLTFNIPTHWAQSSWRLVVTQLEGPPVQAARKFSALSSFGVASNSLQDLRSIFASHHADYSLLAPVGCHQYYTETTGTITSFNYQATLTSNYMIETSYTICIKSTLNTDMIEYNFSKFSMALQTGEGAGYDEACHPTVQTAGRQEDYLMIPQSMLATNMIFQPTYYCGTNNGLVVYASPPFIMYFSSDEKTQNPAQETGFSLTYRLRT